MLRALPRYFFPFLTRFRQPDSDRLLAALDLAAMSFRPAAGCTALVALHFAFDVPARAA